MMATELFNEDYTDYTKAFELFTKGKALVDGGLYDQGMDLLRQSYNMVGKDGAKKMEILMKEAGSHDSYLAEYHEWMGRGYFGLKVYDQALEQFEKWAQEVEVKFGPENIRLVKCHQWMARTWRHIDVVEHKSFDVAATQQKNMEKPIHHYKMAYNLLEAQNGSPSEKKRLKDEIVMYFFSRVCTIQMARSLLMSFLLIPLIILVLIIWGFSWRSLIAIIVLVTVFILWRTINLCIVLTLTWKHHQREVI